MKSNLISHLGIMILCVGTSHGAVIIDKTTGNGAFVNATSGVNVSSITGWSATNNFFVSGTNSGLTTAPFGVDDVTNSRALAIGNTNNGNVITSSTLFSVTVGQTVNLSFDLKSSNEGSGADTDLTILLFDTVSNTTFHTFATFNTSSQINYTQQDLSSGVLGAGSNLALRFTLSDPAGTDKDFRIDRVYLETVPEPSAALLGGLGILVLLRRRR